MKYKRTNLEAAIKNLQVIRYILENLFEDSELQRTIIVSPDQYDEKSKQSGFKVDPSVYIYLDGIFLYFANTQLLCCHIKT